MRLDVCIGLQQSRNELLTPSARRNEQRAAAGRVWHVDVALRLDQALGNHRVPILDRVEERRRAVRVPRVDDGRGGEERRHRLITAESGGGVQWRRERLVIGAVDHQTLS